MRQEVAPAPTHAPADEGRVSELKVAAEQAPVMYVTQSKFFSPAFNAAIFDGPIRIYFAQYQEAQALKIYFNLQARFQDLRKNASGIFKDRKSNIFVMLYPTEETFDLSFSGSTSTALEGDSAADGEIPTERTQGAGAVLAGAPMQRISCDRLGVDYVVGVRGPFPDEQFPELYEELDQLVK
jgi:hypothetical protein